jgi:hypothetical protein
MGVPHLANVPEGGASIHPSALKAAAVVVRLRHHHSGVHTTYTTTSYRE